MTRATEPTAPLTLVSRRGWGILWPGGATAARDRGRWLRDRARRRRDGAMTTRDQVRRAVGAERGEPARAARRRAGPGLPERLLAARERKGVDLYRAERDTKIRARYLAALERGDYRELPGAVYTKGFLRNYALYLGPRPRRRPAPVAARARRPARAAGRHRRPATDRRAAQGPDLLAEPRRLRPAHGRRARVRRYLGVQLLRFASRRRSR